jgi:hypothetical protein
MTCWTETPLDVSWYDDRKMLCEFWRPGSGGQEGLEPERGLDIYPH